MEMVSLESAQKILAQAMEKTTKDFGRPICVSVCDKYGFLIAFARMHNAPVRSIEISRRKAYTAVRMGVSTDAFLARLHKEQIEAGFFGDDMVTALPGGNLLKDAAGNVLGGVGVSGLTSAEDQSITEAMAELVKAGKV
jgi:glc operon protein GlcG